MKIFSEAWSAYQKRVRTKVGIMDEIAHVVVPLRLNEFRSVILCCPLSSSVILCRLLFSSVHLCVLSRTRSHRIEPCRR